MKAFVHFGLCVWRKDRVSRAGSVDVLKLYRLLTMATQKIHEVRRMFPVCPPVFPLPIHLPFPTEQNLVVDTLYVIRILYHLLPLIPIMGVC